MYVPRYILHRSNLLCRYPLCNLSTMCSWISLTLSTILTIETTANLIGFGLISEENLGSHAKTRTHAHLGDLSFSFSAPNFILITHANFESFACCWRVTSLPSSIFHSAIHFPCWRVVASSTSGWLCRSVGLAWRGGGGRPNVCRIAGLGGDEQSR